MALFLSKALRNVVAPANKKDGGDNGTRIDESFAYR
jgi:hypothetical protein